MVNVNIKTVSSALPSKKATTDYYLNTLEENGIKKETLTEVKNMLDELGRKEIRLLEEDEDMLALALKAGKKAIENTDINKQEIDMIITATDTPEYTYPFNSIVIHNELNLTADVTFDVNSNCTSMVVGVDQAATYMEARENVKNALVIGSITPDLYISNDDPNTLPLLNSGASAVILQATEENEKRGIMDSISITDSSIWDAFLYPVAGFSDIHRNKDTDINKDDLQLEFTPVSSHFFADSWKKMAPELLERNGLTTNDVDHWLLSQFDITEIKSLLNEFDLSMDKTTFVGDEIGYTGVCSPFHALEKAINSGSIKKGNNIILTTVSAGYSVDMLLIKL